MRASRIAFAGLAAAALSGGTLAQEVGVGHKAPPLAVAKWIQGNPVKIGDGKMINVIEFWATW